MNELNQRVSKFLQIELKSLKTIEEQQEQDYLAFVSFNDKFAKNQIFEKIVKDIEETEDKKKSRKRVPQSQRTIPTQKLQKASRTSKVSQKKSKDPLKAKDKETVKKQSSLKDQQVYKKEIKQELNEIEEVSQIKSEKLEAEKEISQEVNEELDKNFIKDQDQEIDEDFDLKKIVSERDVVQSCNIEDYFDGKLEKIEQVRSLELDGASFGNFEERDLQHTDVMALSEYMSRDKMVVIKEMDYQCNEMHKSFLEFFGEGYFLNSDFLKVKLLQGWSKLQNQILRIKNQKEKLIEQKGVIDLSIKEDFKYSFFTNFYIKQIEDKKEYQIQNLDNKNGIFIVKLFSLIFQGVDVQSLEEKIKIQHNYTLSIEKLIEMETMIEQNEQLILPNLCFGKNDLTGKMCTILRDHLYYLGLMDNFQHSSEDSHNTVAVYKYLMDKEEFYGNIQKRLKKFCKQFIMNKLFLLFISQILTDNTSVCVNDAAQGIRDIIQLQENLTIWENLALILDIGFLIVHSESYCTNTSLNQIHEYIVKISPVNGRNCYEMTQKYVKEFLNGMDRGWIDFDLYIEQIRDFVHSARFYRLSCLEALKEIKQFFQNNLVQQLAAFLN